MLNYIIGLQMSGLDQAIFDTLLGKNSIEEMLVGGFARTDSAGPIGEFFTIIGQHLDDLEECRLGQAFQEALT